MCYVIYAITIFFVNYTMFGQCVVITFGVRERGDVVIYNRTITITPVKRDYYKFRVKPGQEHKNKEICYIKLRYDPGDSSITFSFNFTTGVLYTKLNYIPHNIEVRIVGYASPIVMRVVDDTITEHISVHKGAYKSEQIKTMQAKANVVKSNGVANIRNGKTLHVRYKAHSISEENDRNEALMDSSESDDFTNSSISVDVTGEATDRMTSTKRQTKSYITLFYLTDTENGKNETNDEYAKVINAITNKINKVVLPIFATSKNFKQDSHSLEEKINNEKEKTQNKKQNKGKYKKKGSLELRNKNIVTDTTKKANTNITLKEKPTSVVPVRFKKIKLRGETFSALPASSKKTTYKEKTSVVTHKTTLKPKNGLVTYKTSKKPTSKKASLRQKTSSVSHTSSKKTTLKQKTSSVTLKTSKKASLRQKTSSVSYTSSKKTTLKQKSSVKPQPLSFQEKHMKKKISTRTTNKQAKKQKSTPTTKKMHLEFPPKSYHGTNADFNLFVTSNSTGTYVPVSTKKNDLRTEKQEKKKGRQNAVTTTKPKHPITKPRNFMAQLFWHMANQLTQGNVIL